MSPELLPNRAFVDIPAVAQPDLIDLSKEYCKALLGKLGPMEGITAESEDSIGDQ
jgi:hypothetical protein